MESKTCLACGKTGATRMALLAEDDVWKAHWLHEECLDRYFTSDEDAEGDESDPECEGEFCSWCLKPKPFVSLLDFDYRKHPFHASCLAAFGEWVHTAVET